jgi:2-polyprenyl-6-methoxyphenol hydroxylase-like FAD-dependent oxidoreductase
MSRHANPAVIVVGANPVGLMGALCLARERVSVQIIDDDPGEPELQSEEIQSAPELVVLDLAALDVLKQQGLEAPVLQAAQQLERLVVCAHGERVGEISFADVAAERGSAARPAVLSRTDLEQILREALAREQVEVLHGRRLALIEQGSARTRVCVERLGRESAGYAVAHSELVVESAEELEPSFALVTDSYATPVYVQLGIAREQTQAPDAYLEFDGALPERAREHEATLLLDDGTASAIWPLRSGNYRGLFGLREPTASALEHALAASLRRLGVRSAPGADLEQTYVAPLLAARAPGLAQQAAALHLLAVFRAPFCRAKPFGFGRVWLAGDAAHATSPLGSQSVNAGLCEAAELAQIFANALRGRDPAAALERYDHEHRREWRRLLGRRERAHSRSGAALAVGDAAGRLLRWLPAHGAELDAELSQLDLPTV